MATAEAGVTAIVALDVGAIADALALVDLLGDACGFYKIGGELFTTEGPRAVAALRDRGKRVFLDLKLHDIPNTVRETARVAARLGASLLTVHATGGASMLRAAVEGAGAGCGVLGVTVLTSLDGPALASAWGRGALDVTAEVVRLARQTAQCGAHGVVCSGHEVGPVRGALPESFAVMVPGVRFLDSDRHDQSRVVTPGAAAVAGARYVVLGRAVTANPDPSAAMRRANEEIVAALTGV